LAPGNDGRVDTTLFLQLGGGNSTYMTDVVVGKFFDLDNYNATLQMRFSFSCASGDRVCMLKKNQQRKECVLDYNQGAPDVPRPGTWTSGTFLGSPYNLNNALPLRFAKPNFKVDCTNKIVTEATLP
jgi:hypothetical protein